MDITTIVEFREAIQQAPKSLLSLKDIEVEVETLSHTRHFAECWATLDKRRVVIYAPITPQAMSYAERAEDALRGKNSRALSSFTIYRNELLLGNSRCCSIIVERPLRGTPLTEMLYTLTNERLTAGLCTLRNSLNDNNLSHNNLRPENILVDNTAAWHCIRQYYTTAATDGDNAAFEHLERLIARHALADEESNELHDTLSTYSTETTKPNRERCEECGLVGFNNERGERVIECKYLWASDFEEGRSMVISRERRAGLIDSDGREVIETRYDEVEYDPNTGRSWVLNDGLWAEFDYLGNQISGWGEES